MADTKITALTALTAADPANDVIPIVDVSDTSMAASGTTKKISVNNILGASGTATLASATITGALTVDTTTLVVNPSGYADRVGVLTASPTHSLDVRGIIKSNGTFTAYINPSFSGAAAIQTESAESLILAPSNQESLRCAPSGVYTFGDGLGSTRMTLNATGLGVGKTPSARLDVASARAASVVGGIVGTTGTGVVADECQFLIKNVNTASGQNNGAGIGGLLEASASNKSSLLFYVDNGTSTVNVGRFDSNGNMINLIQTTAPTLVSNSTFVWNLTSNTNLRVSVRGTDGVTRTGNITLA